MTTRRLHVLRHAKSSWDPPGLPDHERPVSPRGRKAAKRIARVLAAEGVRPQLVLCSPAVRARQTLERVLDALGSPETGVDEALYHAPAESLLARVRGLAKQEAALVHPGGGCQRDGQRPGSALAPRAEDSAAPDDVTEVVVVGHNPGLAELCLRLARPGPERDRVAGNLPTGAFATLVSDLASWTGLEEGGADLVRLLLPREI